MTTHSSIWLLNKLCSRKSYSFTSTGMVIAWMSSSSCPTKSIKQLYSITRQENTTAHRSTFLLWQNDHLSYSLASTVMMEFARATEHTAMKMFSARRWMGGPTFIPPPPTPPPLLSFTVGTDTAIQGGRASWLTRLAYLCIPTISVSPEKNWSCTRWWRSRWSWHTRVCYSTIRKV